MILGPDTGTLPPIRLNRLSKGKMLWRSMEIRKVMMMMMMMLMMINDDK